MTPEEKKRWAAALLREKQEELGRPPKKGDFDGATRSRIKAFLGPWPRALEAAGLREAGRKPAKKGKRPKRAGDARQTETRGEPTAPTETEKEKILPLHES